MLNRRSLLLVSAASLGLGASGCSGKSLPSSFSVSSAKLQNMLAQRFPKQYPVAGLLQIQLQTPQLAMLPERNALNAVMDARLSGPVLKEAFQGMGEMLATYANALAEQALGQVVLYQLQDKDLALVDAMNMQPGAITVTADGLTVAMVQKGADARSSTTAPR